MRVGDALVLGRAIWLGALLPGMAMAANVGVVPKKLIAVDKLTSAGKAKVVYVAKDEAVTKGAGTDVGQISVQFDVVYGNGSGAGTFTLPAGASDGIAGWLVNKDTVARYVNKTAPSGPTEAKVGVVKPGKVLKLVGKGLGDVSLDVIGAGDPGAGGVQTAYCVTNEAEEHCHCSAFTGCAYTAIAGGTGAKLVCKTGTSDGGCSALVPPTTTSTTSPTSTTSTTIAGLGSTLEVQSDNVNSGLFAARIGVKSACTADLHAVITGPVPGGDFVGCSTLTSDADLASGAVTFTAGDLVILRNGFQVAAGASLTVEIDRALYPDAWVQDDTPDGETIYSARFFLDPTSLDLFDGSHIFHFLAFDGGGQPELRVGLKRNGTENRLFLEVFEDNGAFQTTEFTNEILVGPGWHWVDVGWQASAGLDNGRALICLDQPAPPAGCVELSGLDNDTGAIDFVRWGAVDVPSDSDLGLLDIDDFTSGPFDDGFESGSTSAWSAPSGGPVVTCNVPAPYLTIQAAVDDPACSTIVVAPGAYLEGVSVGRSLTLEGAGPGSTVLTGPLLADGSGTQLTLKSFGIDTTGPLTGCFAFALAATGGAIVHPADVAASHGAGPPVGPCPMFDGFASGS